jgi:hypothetical protein
MFDRSREITGISAGIGICIVAIKPLSDTLWRNYRIAADVFVISRSRSVPPIPGCPRLYLASPSPLLLSLRGTERREAAAEPSIYARLAFPWRELFLQTRFFDPPPIKLRFEAASCRDYYSERVPMRERAADINRMWCATNHRNRTVLPLNERIKSTSLYLDNVLPEYACESRSTYASHRH